MEHLISELRDIEDELRAADPAWDKSKTFTAFIEWLEGFPLVWSHVRVSAIAVKLLDAWLARCVQVVLQDTPATDWKNACSDNLVAVEACYPIAELPALVRDIFHGEIDSTRNPISEPLLVRSPNGTPFSPSHGCARDPIYQNVWSEVERYYRYELKWVSEDSLAGNFEDRGNGFIRLRRADEQYEMLGRGSVGEAARDMFIVQQPYELDWDKQPFISLLAPVPLALWEVRQTPERTKLQIDVQIGGLVTEPRILLEGVSPVELPASGKSGLCTFECESPTEKEAVFLLSLPGKRVQRQGVALLPPLHADIRATAVKLFERKGNLLAKGLCQDGERPNANEFERSVGQLLALLGFSVLWWGPNRGGKMAMPEEQADLLAFSADNALVLVVDCTVDTTQDGKCARLAKRAKEIEQGLRKAVSKTPPCVQAVLAVSSPRAEIPALLQMPSKHEVVLLTKDIMERALQKLQMGCPHEEITPKLPEALQCGFGVIGRYRLWPGEIY
jgi:hypothetical protein